MKEYSMDTFIEAFNEFNIEFLNHTIFSSGKIRDLYRGVIIDRYNHLVETYSEDVVLSKLAESKAFQLKYDYFIQYSPIFLCISANRYPDRELPECRLDDFIKEYSREYKCEDVSGIVIKYFGRVNAHYTRNSTIYHFDDSIDRIQLHKHILPNVYSAPDNYKLDTIATVTATKDIIFRSLYAEHKDIVPDEHVREFLQAMVPNLVGILTGQMVRLGDSGERAYINVVCKNFIRFVNSVMLSYDSVKDMIDFIESVISSKVQYGTDNDKRNLKIVLGLFILAANDIMLYDTSLFGNGLENVENIILSVFDRFKELPDAQITSSIIHELATLCITRGTDIRFYIITPNKMYRLCMWSYSYTVSIERINNDLELEKVDIDTREATGMDDVELALRGEY